jgi:hypothetical protein
MQGKDLTEAASNREAIDRIKSLYLRGKISREVAEALVRPVIERINKRQAEVAAKYGKKRYPKTTFIGLMR